MKRLIAATILAVAGFTGCATTPESPAQAVYATQGTYAAALTAAVKYKQLPPCGVPSSPALCARPEVVSQLQKADDVAYSALSAAQKMVRSNAQGSSTVRTAILTANHAVAAFAAIAKTLKVD